MTGGKQAPDAGRPDPHDGMLGYESVRTWIESVQGGEPPSGYRSRPAAVADRSLQLPHRC